MPIEAKLTQRIDALGASLAAGLGSNLACLALYGSAVGDEFSPAHSDINLLIVLTEVHFPDLELIGETLSGEASPDFRLATPLVVAPSFLTDARDSFPIELADIARRHRILAGEDLVSGLSVDPGRVREEAEREARSKLLRLRSLILHRPPVAEIRNGLLGLVSSFSVIERALLGDAASGEELFRHVEQAQGVRLPTLERLCRIRAGGEGWPADDALRDILGTATREVEALVRWVDEHAA